MLCLPTLLGRVETCWQAPPLLVTIILAGEYGGGRDANDSVATELMERRAGWPGCRLISFHTPLCHPHSFL